MIQQDSTLCVTKKRTLHAAPRKLWRSFIQCVLVFSLQNSNFELKFGVASCFQHAEHLPQSLATRAFHSVPPTGLVGHESTYESCETACGNFGHRERTRLHTYTSRSSQRRVERSTGQSCSFFGSFLGSSWTDVSQDMVHSHRHCFHWYDNSQNLLLPLHILSKLLSFDVVRRSNLCQSRLYISTTIVI